MFFTINLYVFLHVQLKLTLICSLGLTESIFSKFPYHLLSKEKYSSECALKIAVDILKSMKSERILKEQDLRDRVLDNFLTWGSQSRYTTETLTLLQTPLAKVPRWDLEVQPLTKICDFLKGQHIFQRKQLDWFTFSFVCCSLNTNSGIQEMNELLGIFCALMWSVFKN